MGVCCPGTRVPDKANRIYGMHAELLDLLKAIRYLYLNEKHYGMVVKLVHIASITRKYFATLDQGLSSEARSLHPSKEFLEALDQDFSDTERGILTLRLILRDQLRDHNLSSFNTPQSVVKKIKQNSRLMSALSKIKTKIRNCYTEMTDISQLAEELKFEHEFTEEDEGRLSLICKYTSHIATSRTRRVYYPQCQHDEVLFLKEDDLSVSLMPRQRRRKRY